MGLIYGAAWHSMALFIPASITMKIAQRSEDEHMEAKDFWLKYWVVFAHYYLIEYFADCFVSWVPFYSELKFLILVMTCPITPFGAMKALGGVPLDSLELNKSPVEAIFDIIVFTKTSSSDGAARLGINRDALRETTTILVEKAGATLQLAGSALQLLMNLAQSSQRAQEIGS